jgi:predicted nucleic acid-binding protein
LTTAVVDASVVMAWLFAESESPRVAAAFETIRRREAVAPVLLYFEMRNALLLAERRRRITQDQSAAFLRQLAKLTIRLAPPGSDEAMALARAHALTFYDAAYLELAKREGLPLATLDRDLEKAAVAEGVALFGQRST